MNDSSIIYDKKGNAVAFQGPDAVQAFRAAALVSAIGLLSKGIKPGRGWSMKYALALATEYTGKTYKRTEYAQAQADVSAWVQAMKAALPSEVRE